MGARRCDSEPPAPKIDLLLLRRSSASKLNIFLTLVPADLTALCFLTLQNIYDTLCAPARIAGARPWSCLRPGKGRPKARDAHSSMALINLPGSAGNRDCSLTTMQLQSALWGRIPSSLRLDAASQSPKSAAPIDSRSRRLERTIGVACFRGSSPVRARLTGAALAARQRRPTDYWTSGCRGWIKAN